MAVHLVRRTREPRRGRGAQLAAFLREARDDILERWELAARHHAMLGQLSRTARVDHLPSVLEDLADVAEEHEQGRPVHAWSEAAERHALERLEQGFDLQTIVREFALLRDSVLELWGQIDAADLAPLHLLDRVMNDAIGASVEQFVDARDHTLRALDGVAAAALEARSIDELFERLLEAFLSSTRAADTGAILLVERGQLVVRATIGLEVEVAEHFSVGDGPWSDEREGFATIIAARREPVHVADDERAVRPETSCARRVRALFGVPLLDGDEVIGVAHMGSHVAPAFSRLDRRLFASMAIRATAGIAQHLARDLAERRAAELAASEQRFRATFASAPVGIAHVALDGTWLRVNARYAQILGYEPDELLALRYQDVIPSSELVTDGAAARALLEGRLDTYAAERRHLRNDGTIVWVRITASIIHEDDAPLPYFIAIVEDITAAKDAARVQRQREAEARHALASERVALNAAAGALAALDGLLAAAPAGITIVDTELRWVRVNEMTARLHGLPVAEHAGRTVRDVLGDRADEVEPRLRRVLETGEVIVTEHVVPGDAAHPEPRYMLVTLFPVRSPGGANLGVGGIIMDITDRKVMEDALRASEQQAQRSVQLRDEVLAIVSHDLKNPLGAIRMATSLLLQVGTLAPEERRYTEVIDRASHRMERLIADLLDLASIESGRLALDLQPHDVHAIVADACEMHQVVARARSIELASAPAAVSATLACDRDRVLQVLGNLIGNALKFGAAEDHVEVDVQREGRELVFSVSDTGPGVAPAELDHMFEAYWTTAPSASKGTGLGLFICKGIVEAHGGRIGAENRTPRGARFWFTLPASSG